jgi:hypothetical protein
MPDQIDSAASSTPSSGDKPKLKHNYGIINKEYAFSLATRAPEEDGPIYMVNLMKYREVAEYDEKGGGTSTISGREADDKYNPASILNKIGASIVFVADVAGNHVGDEDWDRIAIVRYATRRSFIEMQSRKDFGDKHVHKAAGMLRTTLIACRPVDVTMDSTDRPTPIESRTVAMVVRRTPDRDAATSSMRSAQTLLAEGTVIGDGREWDVVQLQHVDSATDVENIARSLASEEPGSVYVMSLRASLDSITQR